MALLEAKDLTVSVANNAGNFRVVSDLSFSLEEGQVLGLVGESGAGKSMIGRTISQLLPQGFSVTGGSLNFAGDDLVTMAAGERRALLGREIAFIPQEPLSALNPVLTIGQQMREHIARIDGVVGRSWRDKAVQALADVQLPDPPGLLARYPHQLSGGQCQRVLIAMAFLSRPRLLIADEPTTALDVTVQSRIVDLIRQMQKRDKTAVIFITHDLRLASEICDEILVLYAGRPVERGPAAEVLQNPAHPYTRCLQLAIPAMWGPRRGLYTLPDRMPGIREIAQMKGCRFATRCPVVSETCHQAEPQPVAARPGHLSACFHIEAMPEITAPPAPQPRGEATEPLLRAEAMAKSYVTKWRLIGQPDRFNAVKAADFALNRGDFVGIVGESGSGKSTIAKLVIGLEPITGGRLTAFGQDITGNGGAARALRREKMQIVFQDPQSALNPRRRVGAIVTQAMEAAGRALPERVDRARDLLGEVGLAPETALRFPSQLSGGQKQRVNIARALCMPPQILVADEIVSGLDVSVQAQLLNLLLHLRDEHGFSMLFISHDLSVVRYLCDRVIVMNKGEIVESGPTETVFADPQHPYTQSLLAAMPGAAERAALTGLRAAS